MSLTATQARANALRGLARRALPRTEKPPPVPCLAARGYAHHRRVVRVGNFVEEATCRHCGDVQRLDRGGAGTGTGMKRLAIAYALGCVSAYVAMLVVAWWAE